MIASGQHTGLAAQVADGRVGLVVLFVGGNDFINALKADDPAAALASATPRALANYRTAVRTILAADPRVKLVVATLPDVRHLPEFAGPIRAGRMPTALADAATAAIRRFNAQVRAIAAADGRVALIDLDLTARLASLLGEESVLVAGRRLDRRGAGNDPDHFFLADVRHPGTLGQGLMAQLLIEAVNAKFGAGIEPLGPRELIALAESVPTPARRDDAVALTRLAEADLTSRPGGGGGGGN
jgi:phospholipase/lecithinase/hemolysin